MELRILELLGQRNCPALGVTEIMSRLRLHERRKVEEVLRQMERRGQVARVKQGDRCVLPQEADLVPGRIRMNRRGIGLLQPDDPKLPVLTVPQDATATAMHGDHVLVRRDLRPGPKRPGESPEATGRVLRILERARTQIVGTLKQGTHFLYVIPDDPRFPEDVYVPPARDTGRPARVGDKVVVELKAWESRHTNPEGEIVEVLGAPDAEGVDMLSVIRQYQLPLHFPKRVLQEAHAIGIEVAPKDFAARVDCRSHRVVTIDPFDAKDFDDAICLERTGRDQWKLWVHIADVSHYVKPGSALDEEAAKRGNSTYLVDRVIPMLPEALSNELCSLKPQVDRLTKCVEFLLAADGQVLKTQFYPAVIHSKRRLHYREALEILQHPPRDDIERMLHDANDVAQKIRRARFQAGSLDLDFPERKIILGDHGEVLRMETVENDISHQLIEEFMLLANEAVAARLMAQHRPAVYRIHEAPNEKKLKEYREDVLSHRIACGNLVNRPEVQKLLASLKQNPIGAALKVGFLRSLMRARYAVEPLGHYGLAKKKYTHFTSPIRRYADLVVHRALFTPANEPVTKGSLKEIADRISETERNSSDAERDSKDVKMMAYLGKQLTSAAPHRYSALVTDVRNFGFFVDVTDLGLSGLVPLSGITDDFYQFDPARNHLVGRRTRRVFKLGDRLEVQVAKVDTFKKQMDFELATTVRPKTAPQGPRFQRERPKSEIRKPMRRDSAPARREESRGPKPARWSGKPRSVGGSGRPGQRRRR